jgi:hypothetical protein
VSSPATVNMDFDSFEGFVLDLYTRASMEVGVHTSYFWGRYDGSEINILSSAFPSNDRSFEGTYINARFAIDDADFYARAFGVVDEFDQLSLCLVCVERSNPLASFHQAYAERFDPTSEQRLRLLSDYEFSQHPRSELLHAWHFDQDDIDHKPLDELQASLIDRQIVVFKP